MSALVNVDHYGFKWGVAQVTRLASFDRGKDGAEAVVLGVKTPYKDLEIYVSPAGRSVRVWLDHKELK